MQNDQNTVFPRINMRSVRMKRYRKTQTPEEIKKMMNHARKHVNFENFKGRKYSKEGLASLRRHMREKVNTKQHYETRNRDFVQDPEWRAKISKVTTLGKREPAKKLPVKKRINDYSGVITREELENL